MNFSSHPPSQPGADPGPAQEKRDQVETISLVARWDVVQQLFRSGGLSILIKVANAFLAYAMLLLIARATTVEQYGIFSVAFSVAITVSFASTVGQPWAIVRFWPQWSGQNQPDKARAFLKLSLIVTAIGLCVTMACMIVTGFVAPALDLPWSFRVVAATALFAFAVGWAEYLSAALRAQGFVVKALVPRDIAYRVLACTTFGGVALLGEKLDAGSVVLLTAILLLVVILPQLLQVYRSCKGIPLSHLTKTDQSSVAKTTAVIWITTVFGIARNHAGIVIVSVYLGAEAAGAYFTAERTANLLSFFLLAANLAAGPMISKYYHSNRHDIVKAVVAVAGLGAGLTAMMGVVFLAMFGGHVLALFDPSFSSFLPVLVIHSVGQLVNAATGPVGLLLTLSGHERVNFAVAVINGILCIGLQIVGGIYYGAIGVALATATGTILGNLAIAFYAWKWLGIDPTGISMVPQFLQQIRQR